MARGALQPGVASGMLNRIKESFMKRLAWFALPAALIALTPTIASAHPGVDGGAHHFAAGLLHPFTGLDHILALMAVGMWAVQLSGGRSARWALVPLAFLACMVLGGLLAWTRVQLPLVEPMILASVLVMGLVLLLALRLPTSAAMGLVGLFALFHGYAHVAEMPVDASAVRFGCGFLIGSAMLLAVGAALGRFMLTTVRQSAWVRAAGGAVAIAAMFLALG
jgi:urease accessory protein